MEGQDINVLVRNFIMYSIVKISVLHMLGTGSWGYCKDFTSYWNVLLKFFALLHLTVKNTNTVFFITMSQSLVSLFNKLF